MEQILSNPILPFVLLFAVMYFFMIRPQVKRQKQEKEFQNSIDKGSKIVTTSGIHGKIIDTNNTDGTVIVETQAGKIKFEKSAISMDLSKKYQTESSK